MKKIIALLLAAIMLIGLTACGGGSQETTKSGETKATEAQPAGQTAEGETKSSSDIVSSKSEMVVRMSADPATCNVYKGTIGQVAGIMRIFQQGLVQYDKTGAIEYLIGESFTEDADGLGTTVKIRQGIKFHNGDPCTADR